MPGTVRAHEFHEGFRVATLAQADQFVVACFALIPNLLHPPFQLRIYCLSLLSL